MMLTAVILSIQLSNLLEEEFYLNARCDRGFTAAQYAAVRGNWVIVRCLLEHDAFVAEPDPDGKSLLHRLASWDRWKLIEEDVISLASLMHSRGINLNAEDKEKQTALQIAAQHHNWGLVKWLIIKGCKVQCCDKYGMTLFNHFATSSVSCLFDSLAEMVALLATKVDVNSKGQYGDTPLCVAARILDWKMVKCLLDVGADASLHDSDSLSVLHYLARWRGPTRHYKCLNNGHNRILPAYLNFTHAQVCASFHVIISETITAAVENGADVSAVGPRGETPLQVSLQYKSPVFWHLLAHNPRLTFQHQEAREILLRLPEFPSEFIKVEVLMRLMEKLHQLSTIDVAEDLNSVICGALIMQNWTVAKVLIKYGADVSSPDKIKRPLTHALILGMLRESAVGGRGWLEVLDLMLAQGANINAEDFQGCTIVHKLLHALHEFADEDAVAFALESLLARGADPMRLEMGRWTPLNILLQTQLHVINSGKDPIALRLANILLKAGVSTFQSQISQAFLGIPRSRPRYFKFDSSSPAETAVKARHAKLLKLLVDSGAASNSELWHLHSSYSAQLAIEIEKDTAEVYDILCKAVRGPKSLLCLCRLQISHLIGCGSDRQRKINALPVPALLKEIIQFHDVLSDVTKSMPPN